MEVSNKKTKKRPEIKRTGRVLQKESSIGVIKRHYFSSISFSNKEERHLALPSKRNVSE